MKPKLLLLPVLAAALLTACAGTPPDMAQTSMESSTIAREGEATGSVIGEVGPARERAKAHTELAAAYYGRGNMSVALEEVRQALAAEANYAPAYNVLGLVHMDLRENTAAQQAFERALRINANDPDTNHNFGWFLCQTNREEQSLRYFLAAVRNPLYATPQKSYSVAASCALQKKNERDAVDFLTRALRIDPSYPPALLTLAQLRYQHGELDEARELVGRFNKLIEPSAESLWLALRIERRLGDRGAEASFANQLRRRFAGTREYEDMQKGRFE
jgi:type IV pilus assembly protein PilF